jgi:hypothetical protein
VKTAEEDELMSAEMGDETVMMSLQQLCGAEIITIVAVPALV